MTTQNSKPALYTPGTTSMWNDPYISQQLLNVHLSDDTDLASRKAGTIDRTISWLLDQCPRQQLSILDLGCGPGLYCDRLEQLGHDVSGIDLSENSITYAKKQNRAVNYRVGNYCTQNLGEKQYDLIIQIFTDFGVLTPEERESLLNSVKKALKPGGVFIFDVMSADCFEQSIGTTSCVEEDLGFWRATPYRCVSESIPYFEERVILSEHTVSELEKDDSVYRFWTKYFSESELNELLLRRGFEAVEVFDSIIPDSDLYRGKDVLFCVAKL